MSINVESMKPKGLVLIYPLIKAIKTLHFYTKSVGFPKLWPRIFLMVAANQIIVAKNAHEKQKKLPKVWQPFSSSIQDNPLYQESPYGSLS